MYTFKKSINSEKDEDIANKDCLRLLFMSEAYIVAVSQNKLNEIVGSEEIEVGLLLPNNSPFCKYDNSKIHIYPSENNNIYSPWKLWQILTNFQPDIVQVEKGIFSLFAFQLALWTRLTSQSIVVFGWENINLGMTTLHTGIRQFILNRTSLIITGDTEGIISNNNGPDLVKYSAYQEFEKLILQPEQDNHSLQEQFNIIFLGALVPEKTIDILFTITKCLIFESKFKQTMVNKNA